MNPRDIINLIRNEAQALGIDPDMAVAIAGKETNFNPDLTRFEPGWRDFNEPESFAKTLWITTNTESVHQATSWGLMQVIGATARDLGFKDHLWKLCNPQTGAIYGCMKLKKLSDIYENEQSVIAAYNAGQARKFPGGMYTNQPYVTDVTERLKRLRALDNA